MRCHWHPLKVGNIHCHHKNRRADGGDDRYSNLVMVCKDVHTLLHAKWESTIGYYVEKLALNAKQKDKLNRLRKRLDLEEICKKAFVVEKSIGLLNLHDTMERRMSGNAHVRCEAGENPEIVSKDYLSLLPKIESAEMMFSASRSRRLSIVPIIQSLGQLEKNYGKDGAEIIIDNTQVTIFGGFAPNSETAQVMSNPGQPDSSDWLHKPRARTAVPSPADDRAGPS